jgi:methylated-DNA-[protein]-cysteine S-methyltransferase
MKFSGRVYQLIKKIPEGRVSTYAEVARAMDSRAYQAVGQALKQNRFHEKIPCFRVVKSNGEIGGYNGRQQKNIRRKIRKLIADGIDVKNNRIINLNKVLYRFR